MVSVGQQSANGVDIDNLPCWNSRYERLDKHAAEELKARRKAAQRREALFADALTNDLAAFWESFVDQIKKDVAEFNEAYDTADYMTVNESSSDRVIVGSQHTPEDLTIDLKKEEALIECVYYLPKGQSLSKNQQIFFDVDDSGNLTFIGNQVGGARNQELIARSLLEGLFRSLK